MQLCCLGCGNISEGPEYGWYTCPACGKGNSAISASLHHPGAAKINGSIEIEEIAMEIVAGMLQNAYRNSIQHLFKLVIREYKGQQYYQSDYVVVPESVPNEITTHNFVSKAYKRFLEHNPEIAPLVCDDAMRVGDADGVTARYVCIYINKQKLDESKKKIESNEDFDVTPDPQGVTVPDYSEKESAPKTPSKLLFLRLETFITHELISGLINMDYITQIYHSTDDRYVVHILQGGSDLIYYADGENAGKIFEAFGLDKASVDREFRQARK